MSCIIYDLEGYRSVQKCTENHFVSLNWAIVWGRSQPVKIFPDCLSVPPSSWVSSCTPHTKQQWQQNKSWTKYFDFKRKVIFSKCSLQLSSKAIWMFFFTFPRFSSWPPPPCHPLEISMEVVFFPGSKELHQLLLLWLTFQNILPPLDLFEVFFCLRKSSSTV